ncbi:hypothetical protein [Staphylococcus aureus]|uniref:hypothetical protein n=1 Tax=Staphylococcus aureus TaxID=1280 RepID=UPI0015E6E23C|nr:hypothetical protein [Staphylococcus aureus]
MNNIGTSGTSQEQHYDGNGDRERVLLGNVISIFKAYSVLLIVIPITQILIYNLALDFKFQKASSLNKNQ